MNPLYQSALDGTLRFTNGGTWRNGVIYFKNMTEVPFRSAWVNELGLYGVGPIIVPGDTARWGNVPRGRPWVFLSAYSGAFMAALVVGTDTPEQVEIHCHMLARPNDIGSYPKPDRSRPIPNDSQRVLVGCGYASNGNPVAREQYWHLGSDSYSIAPGEERVVSYQETSGMQQTTSEQSTVASAFGVTASAGWGPISASASASLSQTTTKMQQVTLTTESIRYESMTLKNTSQKPQMYLKWQLTEVVTVFQKGAPNAPLASLISAIRPVLISGPWDPDNLPSLPEPKVKRLLAAPQALSLARSTKTTRSRK